MSPAAEPHPAAAPGAVTEDGFLGNRVRLRQPADGYRAAIDPVFLAAMVPAAAGERALDIGAGVGTAGLLLAWRVAGLKLTGIEIDPALMRLATENAALNGLADRAEFMVGSLAHPPARLAPGSFHHVLANPPYLESGRHAVPADPGRARAHLEGAGGLEAWLRFGLVMARPKGTLSLIHRADRLGDILAMLRGRAGGVTVFPLWPGPGDKPASRVLVQAVKGSNAPMRLARGLVLHEHDGRFTPEAELVLRLGAPLPLGDRGGA